MTSRTYAQQAAPRARWPWPRLTIRARLTLTYGGLLLAVGMVLVALVYLFMRYWPNYQFATLTAPDDLPSGTDTTEAAPDRREASDVAEALPASGPTVSSESDLFSSLLQVCGLALLVCTVIALGLGWITAGRALAPMRRITAAAAGIAARNLHERVSLTGPDDEIKELADTFDGMLTRLEAAFATQRRFAANASHELLSPLAASRTILEVAAARPEACDVTALTGKLLAAHQRSEEIVESLLTLARADHGAVTRHPVDLAASVEDAVDRVRADAAGRGVTVHTDLAPAVIPADRALIGHLADNLLRNAIRHNHPGGTVTVDVTAAGPGAAPALTVTNTGPKVPPAKVAQLFEPFVRLEARTHRTHRVNRAHHGGREERAGHGLGMAIIRAVAEAHDSEATACANPGGGLTVTVTFATRPATLAPPR